MTSQEINYNAGAGHRAEIHKEINSTPVRVDRSVFQKDKKERADVQAIQSNFKRNGLYEWNERNRPGNNKKVQPVN